MQQEHATWRFFRWSHDTWEAMLGDFENAEKSIDFEQYYLVDIADGLIGHRFIEVLERKARQGVRVRILLDATGSWDVYMSADIIARLSQAGAQVQFHKTIPRKHAGRFLRSFLRDHRRLVIVDGAIGYVGGTAIKETASHWRDTHARLEGPVVSSLERAFEHVWVSVSGIGRFKITKPQKSPDKFAVVPNSPLPRHRFIYKYFLDAIRGAKKSIYVSTPYFVPDHKLYRALRLAAKRGVDVRILVPERCDSKVVQVVSESYYDGAFRSGMKIYEYQPSFLHAKTMVVDDDWATVGSCNFDQLSFKLNYELNVVSYDPKFAFALKNHFFDDLQSAAEVRKDEWGRRLFLRKILEKLSFVLRPFV